MTEKPSGKAGEFMKRMRAEAEEIERKEREAFERLSTQEKFQRLREAIADLDMRLHEHILDGPHLDNEA